MAYEVSTSVQIQDCSKTYPDGTRGLQPTQLTVEPGEVLALLGPSGCGKTTLLRLIAGLETPDAGGRILFDAQDVTRLPIEKRQVGMMFQHYALFPQMTVFSNIAYGLRIRKVPDTQLRKQVGDLVDLMRLNGLEKRRPSELSGGQRQRVALARAVAAHPRVLLLDEPLTALDAKLKESLRDELAELLRQLRITAVHVTHDQLEAMAIADRMAIMQAGRVLQIGDGESLYRRPADPFVASFLGRVNQLARSDEQARDNVLRWGSVVLPCGPACQGATQLLVRPEDIEVCTPSDQDVAVGQISRRLFLGDRVQLTVDLPEVRSLLIDVGRDHGARTGDVVGIRVAAHHWMPLAEAIC
jgi:putative spermidine/putrescine transport system ATP-binding protein